MQLQNKTLEEIPGTYYCLKEMDKTCSSDVNAL